MTTSMIILMVLGVAFAALSLVCLIKPWMPSALAAYMALILMHLSTAIYLTDNALIFWTIATLIIVTVKFATPAARRRQPFAGVLYISVAAIAGGLLGMAIGSRFVTLAIVLGAVLGEYAYFKTPRGKQLGFSFSRFYEYFCSDALNVIVSVAQLRLILEGSL